MYVKQKKKKTMGLTEMLLCCRGWTWKNSWRAAMADTAIHISYLCRKSGVGACAHWFAGTVLHTAQQLGLVHSTRIGLLGVEPGKQADRQTTTDIGAP